MNNKSKKEWHAVTVAVPKEGSDWISHLLFELGSIGNLEEDGPDPASIATKGYFPTEIGSSQAIIQSIMELLEEKGVKPLSTYSTTLKIQNWAEAAQQMFAPIKILDDITIISPWSDYKPGKGEEVIVINPGMAFGTGLHATTQLSARLVVEALDSLPHFVRGGSGRGRPSLLDVGCGSAILSIIAAKKGATKVSAVEIDDDAGKSALENIKRNRCTKIIKLFKNIDQAGGQFNIVVANILYATIVELRNELMNRAKDGGFLVISGITTEEDERLLKAFDGSAARLIKKTEQDGWMGYLFKMHHSGSDPE